MVIAEIGLYMGMREVDAEVASIEKEILRLRSTGETLREKKPLNLCLSEKGEKGLFGNKEGDALHRLTVDINVVVCLQFELKISFV